MPTSGTATPFRGGKHSPARMEVRISTGASCGAAARALIGACVVTTVIAVGFAVQQRYTLARDLTWQCDELPVLSRFTSVGSAATTEDEARAFQPSLYSLRTGAIRSLRIPPFIFSPQTTTHFWTSLTLNTFGYGTLAGRVMPLVWGCVAILAVAWATWLCAESVPACCVASLIVAFSPAAVAYSAQARGYSEALALLPLMLVALELFRRKSTSWIRVAFLAIVTVQLSLTVYTMWVYWVFPVLVVSVLIVPRAIQDPTARPSARALLVGLLVLMCVWMGIFTAERWKSLTFASTYGARFETLGELGSFSQRFVVRLLPLPIVTIPLAAVGVFQLRRSSAAWWRAAMLAGVTLPIVFGIANGSPGFMRNLSYILGPLAIVGAVGFFAALRALSLGGRKMAVGVVSLVTIAGFAAGSSVALADQAYRFILPDWGAVVRSIDSKPREAGPRWICPCAANHWQINWYRDRSDDAAFWSLSVGDRIEVVMGAQLNDDGDAVVFRHNERLDGVRSAPLPEYLSRVRAAETYAGVELRRWRGTKIGFGSLPISDAPVLVLAKLERTPSSAQWARFLRDYGAFDAGVVIFNERFLDGEQMHTMMIPSMFAGRVHDFLHVELSAVEEDLSWIALTPFKGDWPSERADAVGVVKAKEALRPQRGG